MEYYTQDSVDSSIGPKISIVLDVPGKSEGSEWKPGISENAPESISDPGDFLDFSVESQLPIPFSSDSSSNSNQEVSLTDIPDQSISSKDKPQFQLVKEYKSLLSTSKLSTHNVSLAGKLVKLVNKALKAFGEDYPGIVQDHGEPHGDK